MKRPPALAPTKAEMKIEDLKQMPISVFVSSQIGRQLGMLPELPSITLFKPSIQPSPRAFSVGAKTYMLGGIFRIDENTWQFMDLSGDWFTYQIDF